MTEFRKVHIGRDWLDFYFVVDPGAMLEEGFRLHPDSLERAGQHYAVRLQEEVAPGIAPLTAEVEPWTGPKVGGPLPLQTELVWLLGLANDAIGDIVNLAAFAILIREGIARIRAATGNSPHVSDGLAAILAADAIFDETGVIELTLAFVTQLRKPLRNLDELESSWDGFMVGYRTEGRLMIAHVRATGEVTLTTDTPFVTAPDEDAG